MSERDPRLDPRPGDALRKKGPSGKGASFDYSIRSVGRKGFVFMDRSDGIPIPKGRGIFSLWAKGAEVIRRAEDETTDRTE